ncbi:MAG: chemotaxis protein CheB [Candidatus Paceibacterota bacterium]
MNSPIKPGRSNKNSSTLVESSKKTRHKKLVSVVGIGASAGGLEAFRELLKNLPLKTGMAYVLVQHLDRNHESMLTELLMRFTSIPVTEVKHRTLIKPDHIYVIPPGKNISLSGESLTLTVRPKEKGLINMPIDHFFNSLAAREENAIGIVLSGSASDGTIGLRAIKDAGGLTFAQDITAKYQGMPMSAISAGVVDYVLPPHQIAEEIVALAKHPLISRHRPLFSEEGINELSDYKKIIGELLRMTGVDFSHYKEATLTRRVRRRMVVNKTLTPKDYLNFLRGNSKEAEALFKDILIHVTGFFRDPVTLKCLSNKVLPQIAPEKSVNEPLRIWVPGCSTGEEVYSLAMVLLDFFGDKNPPPVQIFGTDLSYSAIEKARRGTYTKSDISSIPPRYLERFFQKINGVYRIQKYVRDMCVFSVHNLLKDPAFARIDIVSCCNVLIYMDTTLQKRMLATFHYALRPQGFLVLGKSETSGAATGLFTQVDKKNKVFAKKIGSKKAPIPIVPRNEFTPNIARVSSNRKVGVMTEANSIQDEADALLVDRYAPASVLINVDYEILQLRGKTEKYLKLPSGKVTLNLMKMVREELVYDLRSAIQKAKKSQTTIKREVQHLTKFPERSVFIEVIPLKKKSVGIHFLIVFQSLAIAEDATPTPIKLDNTEKSSLIDNRKIEQLQKELLQAQDNARSYGEEQEAANEELQSANEEILSSNEELQSINEELETSTEELESSNEELNTINQELQTRNEEVTEARDYSESIISTMRSPLLILK